MTNEFLPPPIVYSRGGDYDFFGGIVAPNPNVPRYRNTFSMREVTHGRQGTGVYEWTLTIWDFAGGLNATWGDFNSLHNRLSESEGWTHLPGYVTLPYDIPAVTDSTQAPSTLVGVHHANIFGTMAIGFGSDANASLWTATSGAPSARTYSPASAISTLAPVVIGGATAAEQLAVGFTGTAVEILSDLAATPTSAGSMNAATNPCWGIIQVPINAATPGQSTLLMYIQQTISTLASTSAIGTAPTSVLTNIPGGGFAIGNAAPDGVHRAWWVWPKQHTSTGMLASLTQLGRIVSTNWEGSDVQSLDTPLKNGVLDAVVWNGGIVYRDSKEIYWYRGGVHRNLGFLRDRDTAVPAGGISGTRTYSVEGLTVANDVLYALKGVHTAFTPGSRTLQGQIFNPDNWSWHASDEGHSAGNSVSYGRARPAGSWPYSYDGATKYWLSASGTGDLSFYRQAVPSPSVVPMFLGTTNFTSSASFTTPNWILPGLINVPSVIEEIQFGGYLNSKFGFSNSSSADASVTVSQITQAKDAPDSSLNAVAATFRERDRASERRRYFLDNTNAFTYLQLQIDIAQAASNATVTTPNAVPLIVRGLAFPTGTVMSPRRVRQG